MMFFILATKPLNDNTKGFRFNFLGLKGLTRKRKVLSRGWFNVSRGSCMTSYHFGKRTIYLQNRGNKYAPRKLCHFAG